MLNLQTAFAAPAISLRDFEPPKLLTCVSGIKADLQTVEDANGLRYVLSLQATGENRKYPADAAPMRLIFKQGAYDVGCIFTGDTFFIAKGPWHYTKIFVSQRVKAIAMIGNHEKDIYGPELMVGKSQPMLWINQSNSLNL